MPDASVLGRIHPRVEVRVMTLLFVCQGNTCRSPVAERLATLWAAKAAKAEPAEVGVAIASAGLGAQQGQHIHPLSALALQELGGRPNGFLSQMFTPGLARDGDLVITMTRAQRRSVLEEAPRRLRSTFTLTEAAALLPLVDVSDLSRMPPQLRLKELGVRLDAVRAQRPAPQWKDISDPVGRRAPAHRAAAQNIAEALRPLVEVLFSGVAGSAQPKPRSVAPRRPGGKKPPAAPPAAPPQSATSPPSPDPTS